MTMSQTYIYQETPAYQAGGDAAWNLPGTIAPLQTLVLKKPLQLAYQYPASYPPPTYSEPTNLYANALANNPSGDVAVPGSYIPQNSFVNFWNPRNICLCSPATGADLTGVTFQINFLDQFGNQQSITNPGPPTGTNIEVSLKIGSNQFYCSQLLSIIPTAGVTAGMQMWAAVGSEGQSPFFMMGNLRTGWDASVEIFFPDPPGADGSYKLNIYGTNYPIYAPKQLGGFYPISNPVGVFAGNLINGDITENDFIQVNAPYAYIWVSIARESPPDIVNSAFTVTVLQQGMR